MLGHMPLDSTVNPLHLVSHKTSPLLQRTPTMSPSSYGTMTGEAMSSRRLSPASRGWMWSMPLPSTTSSSSSQWWRPARPAHSCSLPRILACFGWMTSAPRLLRPSPKLPPSSCWTCCSCWAWAASPSAANTRLARHADINAMRKAPASLTFERAWSFLFQVYSFQRMNP